MEPFSANGEQFRNPLSRVGECRRKGFPATLRLRNIAALGGSTGAAPLRRRRLRPSPTTASAAGADSATSGGRDGAVRLLEGGHRGERVGPGQRGLRAADDAGGGVLLRR